MKNNKSLAFLALVFVALFSYWTVEQVRFYQEKNRNKSFNNLPDTSSSSTEKVESEPDNSKGEVTSKDSAISNSSTLNSAWIATDYKQGDISKGSYKVKSGDTLWEIAEAVYGDGTQWVNILNTNSGSIGYLPNGQQALIFPDQILVIP